MGSLSFGEGGGLWIFVYSVLWRICCFVSGGRMGREKELGGIYSVGGIFCFTVFSLLSWVGLGSGGGFVTLDSFLFLSDSLFYHRRVN